MGRGPGRPPLERFWRKVITNQGGCWVWIGALAGTGYSSFRVRPKECVPAHRWSYEQFVGPIPAGLEIDHLCRNRACVNPAHLEPVDRRTNMLRGMHRSALFARGVCQRGHPRTETNVYHRRQGDYCAACARLRSQMRQE